MVSIYDEKLTKLKKNVLMTVKNSVISKNDALLVNEDINSSLVKSILLFHYNNIFDVLNDIKIIGENVLLLKTISIFVCTSKPVFVDTDNMYLTSYYKATDNNKSASCIVTDLNGNLVENASVEVYYSDNSESDFELLDTLLSDSEGQVHYLSENNGFIKFKCGEVWSSYVEL